MAKVAYKNKDFLNESIELEAANEFTRILNSVIAIENLEKLEEKKKQK